MTLTEFLESRLAEDEAAVWHALDCARGYAEASCTCDVSGRSLREVEAKRRSLRRAMDLLYAFDHPADGMWSDVNRRERFHARRALDDLAVVYADHPDYRDEWRP